MREADKLAIGENLTFEGMTSIRAVLDAIKSGRSDRRITRIMVAESRQKARAKGIILSPRDVLRVSLSDRCAPR